MVSILERLEVVLGFLSGGQCISSSELFPARLISRFPSPPDVPQAVPPSSSLRQQQQQAVPSFLCFIFRHFGAVLIVSPREIRFSAQALLAQVRTKTVHILCVSGLRLLIAVSIFPALALIPATAYFWLMLPASRSFWSFPRAPALPPTGTAASPAPGGPSPAHGGVLGGWAQLCTSSTYFNPEI